MTVTSFAAEAQAPGSNAARDSSLSANSSGSTNSRFSTDPNTEMNPVQEIITLLEDDDDKQVGDNE